MVSNGNMRCFVVSDKDTVDIFCNDDEVTEVIVSVHIIVHLC